MVGTDWQLPFGQPARGHAAGHLPEGQELHGASATFGATLTLGVAAGACSGHLPFGHDWKPGVYRRVWAWLGAAKANRTAATAIRRVIGFSMSCLRACSVTGSTAMRHGEYTSTRGRDRTYASQLIRLLCYLFTTRVLALQRVGPGDAPSRQEEMCPARCRGFEPRRAALETACSPRSSTLRVSPNTSEQNTWLPPRFVSTSVSVDCVPGDTVSP